MLDDDHADDGLDRPAAAASRSESDGAPSRIILVPYPKIIFLYPVFLASIVIAIYLSLSKQPLDASNTTAAAINAIFLAILAINVVVLAFDFPRTTSLTLFFFAAAVAMGLVLLFVLKPHLLPAVTQVLSSFRPLANAQFYWGFASIMAVIYIVVLATVQFDYWEVRPNELLHHHGFLSNLERFPAPNLRIDKEINDVFEYLLLHSGRLILQSSNERRAIILDNIPFIKRKEASITRMLGALQVQVRKSDGLA